jgi:hypothetical protein
VHARDEDEELEARVTLQRGHDGAQQAVVGARTGHDQDAG